MKIVNLFVLILSMLLLSCQTNFALQETPTPMTYTTKDGDAWELVWSDEFEESGLADPERWDYEVGIIRNNEAQYYTKADLENARVENGYLIIEAKKESYEGMDYTSASLITKEKGEWTYGRIEVRADIPSGVGMWPAIWMLGINIDQVGWPMCGEIDIMENVGFEPETIYGTVHTDKFNHLKGTAQGASKYVPDVSEDFHVYAIEWTSEKIDFFIDNDFYFTFVNNGEGVSAWPFDNPLYLILNIAIGGTWGGQQGIDDTIFPQQMRVDYVRVFQPMKP